MRLKRFRALLAELKPDAAGAASQSTHSHELAAACLMMEVARADFEKDETELAAIMNAIQSAFSLSEEETRELVDNAESQVEASVSLHEFTRSVNEAASMEERVHIIELMWRVAYSDGNLDKYEEALIRRVADLLYVGHEDFIRTKAIAERP